MDWSLWFNLGSVKHVVCIQIEHNRFRLLTFVLCLRLGMPPPRYQAVYVDMDQTSYYHAQSICENFGSGLATVLDQLDFETLNTTLKDIKVEEYCGERMFLGASSPANISWSWRTGESISNDWEHWYPGEPASNGEVCLRMGIDSAYWMKMYDHYCTNDNYQIPRFKCCICDTLSWRSLALQQAGLFWLLQTYMYTN